MRIFGITPSSLFPFSSVLLEAPLFFFLDPRQYDVEPIGKILT